MRAAAPLFSISSKGLKLSIRLTPKASRDGFDGIISLADGRRLLRARVRAVPEKGKANDALVRLLAKTLDIPRIYVTLVSGGTSRIKTLLISADTAHLKRKVETLIAQMSQQT